MNIKLFGYSISLNVLILIGVLYLIMVVNALSGSCNTEGLKGPAGKAKREREKRERDKLTRQRAAMLAKAKQTNMLAKAKQTNMLAGTSAKYP